MITESDSDITKDERQKFAAHRIPSSAESVRQYQSINGNERDQHEACSAEVFDCEGLIK